MMVDTENTEDILLACRAYREICQKYPFTHQERATLEHLWAIVEDRWLDAELENLERMEMREA